MGGINVKITIAEALLQKVAPHPCFGCGKIGSPLCINCKYNIISEPFSGCCLCGNVSTLGICAHHDVPICKAWVVSQRVTVLKRVINAYKFEYVKSAAHVLANLLDESLPILPTDVIIVPIPTASAHVRQRGYDHMDILARIFAQRRGLVLTHLLERSSSKAQHSLNKADRLLEASGAFHLTKHVTLAPNTPLLILDDIITTGSTVTSAAQVLADGGFQNIFVGAIAYQPLD